MKQVHRKESVNAQDAVLHLFDFPLEEFKKGLGQNTNNQNTDVKGMV